MAVLTGKARKSLSKSDFAIPETKSYPIHDRAHAANALARASGKPEEGRVRAAVCRRYPDLPACEQKKYEEFVRSYQEPVPGINWLQVTPAERKRLEGLIEHYRKMPHPFTACVRDNTKRFGKERAERICAVLKDLIEGGTGWRKGRKMADGSDLVGVPEPYLTHEELIEVLDQADRDRY